MRTVVYVFFCFCIKLECQGSPHHIWTWYIHIHTIDYYHTEMIYINFSRTGTVVGSFDITAIILPYIQEIHRLRETEIYVESRGTETWHEENQQPQLQLRRTVSFTVEPPFRRWFGRNKQGIEDTWTLFKIV